MALRNAEIYNVALVAAGFGLRLKSCYADKRRLKRLQDSSLRHFEEMAV